MECHRGRFNYHRCDCALRYMGCAPRKKEQQKLQAETTKIEENENKESEEVKDEQNTSEQ